MLYHTIMTYTSNEKQPRLLDQHDTVIVFHQPQKAVIYANIYEQKRLSKELVTITFVPVNE